MAMFLPEIDSCFKSVIKCLRKHKEYLPRDADLKKMLKSQRFLVSDQAKVLVSDDRLDLSKIFCLEIVQEIRKKLQIIDDLAKQLPGATQEILQPKSVVSSLKVSNLISMKPLALLKYQSHHLYTNMCSILWRIWTP